MRLAVVIPAKDEEESLPRVLNELRPLLEGRDRVVVGINGSSDATAEVASAAGAEIGFSERGGYGRGCLAALEVLAKSGEAPDVVVFLAGDGANDPAGIASLLEGIRAGADLVLGQRVTRLSNWPVLGVTRAAAHAITGAACWATCGRFFVDLGPFRAIRYPVLRELDMREPSFGWTIEMQVAAVRAGYRVDEIVVEERPRIAGEQKVTGRGISASLRVLSEIVGAAWRARRLKRGSQARTF